MPLQKEVRFNPSSKPLQQLHNTLLLKMPPPFSEWFSPLPFKLDTLAQAAKVWPLSLSHNAQSDHILQFQHERMASAARFWKRRCAEYQAVLNRCKEDLANMKALKRYA